LQIWQRPSYLVWFSAVFSSLAERRVAVIRIRDAEDPSVRLPSEKEPLQLNSSHCVTYRSGAAG